MGRRLRSKRVLVVHYFFPPLGGAGVPRVLKFVKYLPELGWDVTVIAANARWYGVCDPTLLDEVPPTVRVIRARELPVARARRRLIPHLSRLGVPQVRHYIGWPDETSGWVPAATAAALRVTRRWRPDVVLSSAYPYSAHLVALAASRAAGVPWVADFRDAWTRNPQGDEAPRPLGRINAAAERALVSRADGIVVVDDDLQLVGLAADDPRRVVIPNGVDDADLDPPAAAATPPADRFRLSYVGSLYGTRDAEPVLAAVARLARAGIIDRERFEVSIVGNVWLGAPGLGHDAVPVRLTGYVDHERALREMRQATALLFYAPASTRAPSGKIYEYLTAGRPILSVARRDNLASRLVIELGAGSVAEPDRPAEIEHALAELYGRWAAGSLEVAPDVRQRTLERFSRRRLTADLAEVLAEVRDRAGGRGV